MSLSQRVDDLLDAVEEADRRRVLELLDGGVDINATAADGRCAIHAALAECALEIAVLLLDRGALLTIIDNSGCGALHWAARSNSVAALVIALTADTVDPTDVEGRTPLSWCAQGGDQISIDWLLDKGADPNSVDDGGWTPLHYAAADGRVNAINSLLARGADPRLRLPTGHLASDLARHFASDSEAVLILEAAELAE